MYLVDKSGLLFHLEVITKKTRSKVRTGDLVPLFDVTKYSTREIKQFKYNAVGYIADLLSKDSFVDKVCTQFILRISESGSLHFIIPSFNAIRIELMAIFNSRLQALYLDQWPTLCCCSLKTGANINASIKDGLLSLWI